MLTDTVSMLHSVNIVVQTLLRFSWFKLISDHYFVCEKIQTARKLFCHLIDIAHSSSSTAAVHIDLAIYILGPNK